MASRACSQRPPPPGKLLFSATGAIVAAPVSTGKCRWRGQPDTLPLRREDGAARFYLESVVCAGIVKGGRAFGLEPYSPAHRSHYPHNLVQMNVSGRLSLDRHEIDYFADSFRTQESSDENIRLGEVHLFFHAGMDRVDLKEPPFFASRIEANTLGESKCGRQHHSIEPSLPTNAAICRSPITP